MQSIETEIGSVAFSECRWPGNEFKQLYTRTMISHAGRTLYYHTVREVKSKAQFGSTQIMESSFYQSATYNIHSKISGGSNMTLIAKLDNGTRLIQLFFLFKCRFFRLLFLYFPTRTAMGLELLMCLALSKSYIKQLLLNFTLYSVFSCSSFWLLFFISISVQCS